MHMTATASLQGCLQFASATSMVALCVGSWVLLGSFYLLRVLHSAFSV